MKYKSVLYVVVLIFAFLLSGQAWAITTNCNGTLSDCQSKVTAATSGDIITVGVSGGSYSWSGALTMKAGVILQGFGMANTHITSSGTAIDMTDADGSRITAINFIGSSTSAHLIQGSDVQNIRIDNNLFSGAMSMGIWFQYGSELPSGVVDSNTFTGDIESQYVYVQYTSGRTGWESAIDFGSADWVFVEGNTCSTTGSGIEAFETQYGGKMVVRWNTISESTTNQQTTLFEQHNTGEHGADGGDSCGRAQEIYSNRINLKTSVNARRLLYWRAGTGLVYNNVVDYSGGSEPSGYFELISYRVYDGCTEGSPSSNYSPTLGPKMQTRCCRSTYTETVDGHELQGEGYPCNQQTGMGVWGGTHEPIYFWDNYKTANGTTLVVLDSDYVGVDETAQWAIALNRDYCVSTSGKPASCGGHTITYTPYQCPHPITGLTGSCDTAIAGATGYNVPGTTTPPSKVMGVLGSGVKSYMGIPAEDINWP